MQPWLDQSPPRWHEIFVENPELNKTFICESHGSLFHVSMFLFCWDVLCDQFWDSQAQSFVQNTKTNSPPMSTYSGVMAPPKPSMPEHYIKWSNSCCTLALSGISGTPGLPQVSPHHFCNVQPLCSWDPLQTSVTSRRFWRSNCYCSTGPNHTSKRPKKKLVGSPMHRKNNLFVCWNSKSTWSTFKRITPSFLNSLPDNFIGLDMDKTTTPL